MPKTITILDTIDWTDLLSRFIQPAGNFRAIVGGEDVEVGSCVCITEPERQEIVAMLSRRPPIESAEVRLVEAGDELYAAFVQIDPANRTKGQIEALTNYANASNAYRGHAG